RHTGHSSDGHPRSGIQSISQSCFGIPSSSGALPDCMRQPMKAMSSLHQAAVVLSVVLGIPNPLGAQLERAQSRLMTVSRNGIVATSQTLASAAGAKILERGGSAADAAIAANAVISVVEPMMGGVGGDLFVIYWEAKTKKLYGLNASGWAPKALTIDFLKSKGITNLSAGIHASPVPGCVDGWSKLHKRFGRLPWADVFQPAIYYAREGYPVTERIQDYWWHRTGHLLTNKAGAEVFARNGVAPVVGEVFRNALLADTLSLIARDGADAFYRGPIAKSILQTSDHFGGTMASSDLAEY